MGRGRVWVGVGLDVARNGVRVSCTPDCGTKQRRLECMCAGRDWLVERGVCVCLCVCD